MCQILIKIRGLDGTITALEVTFGLNIYSAFTGYMIKSNISKSGFVKGSGSSVVKMTVGLLIGRS